MKDASAFGRDMSIMLRPTFDDVSAANGFDGPIEKGQLWAGFMAAANGAMYAQLGAVNARIINDAIRDAVTDVARSKLQVLKP
ncbi:hypothetical protein [Pseudomonas sp. NBRC 111119]|uniref:hypothetical protein n=1 Tax=Pseudomonas sp. NBRC 111119 TaxID=1661034 RepID=UPI000762020F|nr:hypothetical protein [Pseudomonas sp. NBRC 111119]